MAKIQYHKGGGIIKWGVEDWTAGLHPQYSNSTTPARMLGNYLGTSIAFDPYRNLGWATPGYTPTALENSSVIDAVQVNLVINGTFAYTIGGTKVHQITISSATITTPTTFPHIISGATGGQDLIVYGLTQNSATRTNYLLYSWYDGSNGNIGIYNFSTTFEDDWMSNGTFKPANFATFTTASPHIFKIGSDDILYVTDGRFIHALDGATGANSTLSKNVLTLPLGYIANGFARIDPDTLAVFAYLNNASGSLYYKGQIVVFFWNYLDLDPYKVVYIQDNYVSAPFEYEGTIGCFAYGVPTDKSNSAKTGKMYLWNGSTFELKANYEDKSGGSTPLITIGGVDIIGKQIQWNVEGDIYSYGNNFDLPIVLNKIAQASGTTCGLLKTVSTLAQYSSSGITTSGGMESLNNGYRQGAVMTSSLVNVDFPIRQTGQAKRIRIKFKEAVTGGLTFSLFITDEEGNQVTIIDAITTITAGKTIYEREYTSAGAVLPAFDMIKITFYWAETPTTYAPIVESVELEYENKNIVVV